MTAKPWVWPNTRIDRIIDGDTLDVTVTRQIDYGFGWLGGTTFPIRVRLNRINTPALRTARGRTARNRVADLLHAGWTYTVTTYKPYKYSGPQRYAGEWMAEVELPGGRLISDLLAGEGLATYWDGTGERPNDE